MKTISHLPLGLWISSVLLTSCLGTDSAVHDDDQTKEDHGIYLVSGYSKELNSNDGKVLIVASQKELKELEGLEGFKLSALKMDNEEKETKTFFYLVENDTNNPPVVNENLKFSIKTDRDTFEIKLSKDIPTPKSEEQGSRQGYKIQGAIAGLKVNDQSYDELTKHKERMVVIFSASWCAPCQQLKSAVEGSKSTLERKCSIQFVKVHERASTPNDSVVVSSGAKIEEIAPVLPTFYLVNKEGTTSKSGLNFPSISDFCTS